LLDERFGLLHAVPFRPATASAVVSGKIFYYRQEQLMLIDLLENAGAWALADEALAFALRWLRNPESAQLAPGAYELRGRDLYAIVAEYETRPPEACRLETHRRYIDV
jgi:hypothetical protein